MRPTSAILALLVGVLPFAGEAQERDVTDPYWRFRESNEFDESLVEPWREQGGEVPPLPADDTFSAVPLDRLPGGMRAYLHLPSVTVGEDEVVRYWLVIKGDAGGYNASFEGTRCSAQEYKVYAYGFPGRQEPVMPADDPGWRSTDAPGYRQELTADVLCTGPNPNTARQIDSVLRHGPRQGHAFDGFFRF